MQDATNVGEGGRPSGRPSGKLKKPTNITDPKVETTSSLMNSDNIKVQYFSRPALNHLQASGQPYNQQMTVMREQCSSSPEIMKELLDCEEDIVEHVLPPTKEEDLGKLGGFI